MQDKNKKISYAIIIVAVLSLLVITIWQPGQLGFVDQTDYATQQKLAEAELTLYKEFLADLNPNYEASKKFLQKIVDEDLVREQVEATLQTKQTIVIPEIKNQELQINSRNDINFVANYLTDVSSIVANYRNDVTGGVSNLFADNSDSVVLAKAQDRTNQLLANLKQMSVPVDAVALHKASLVAFAEYGQTFEEAKKYSQNEVSNPWPQVYHNYAVIDNQLSVVKTELQKINQQFALVQIDQENNSLLVKTANAQLLGGITIITADLERQVIEGLKEALAKSFARFAITMLDKLVAHIEKNFAIASQLYYSNELGRYYSAEYMKKFVADPLDRDIIQQFLPEYFCVQPDKKKLREVFTAKARTNIGNDLIINPADPDFLNKLTRLGSDEKNYPLWWEGYYESLAARTKNEADIAATKEVISPGLKTGRDLVSKQVNKTVATIFNVQESAIAGVINLGTNNAQNTVGQMISGVVEGLVNKFVFTPISGGASGVGGVGILVEQDVCLQVPLVKPLIPLDPTEYQQSDGKNIKTSPTTPPFFPRN